MPRTDLTKTAAPGAYPSAGTLITYGNADASNGNSFVFNANELVVVKNVHASAAKTVTLTSSADTQGRTKNITAESIPAGVTRIFGPFTQKMGWQQTGGVFHIDGEDTNVRIAVISLT